MKKIIVFILILIGLELGATYYVGNLAEQRFRQVIEALNQTPGGSAKVEDYQKSFFYSKAKTIIKLYDVIYTFNSVIHHGPIIFMPIEKGKSTGSPVKFMLASVSNQLVSVELVEGPGASPGVNQGMGSEMMAPSAKATGPITPPIPMILVMNFPYSGNMEMTSNSPPFEIGKNEILVKSTGWDTIGHFDRHGKWFDINTSMNELAIGKSPEKIYYITLKGLKQKNEYKKTDDGQSSHGLITIDKISSPMFPGVEASFLKLDFNVLTHITTMDIAFGFSLDSLVYSPNSAAIGPEKIQIKIENIDLEALKIANSNKDTGLNNEQGKIVATKILQKKPKLIIHAIELNFPDSPDMQIPKGKILLDGKFTVGNETISSSDLSNFGDVIKTAQGELNGVITKELFKAIIMNMKLSEMVRDPNLQNMTPDQRKLAVQQAVDQAIAEYTTQGVLKESPSNYEIKITIVNGQWIAPATGKAVGTGNATGMGSPTGAGSPAGNTGPTGTGAPSGTAAPMGTGTTTETPTPSIPEIAPAEPMEVPIPGSPSNLSNPIGPSTPSSAMPSSATTPTPSMSPTSPISPTTPMSPTTPTSPGVNPLPLKSAPNTIPTVSPNSGIPYEMPSTNSVDEVGRGR